MRKTYPNYKNLKVAAYCRIARSEQAEQRKNEEWRFPMTVQQLEQIAALRRCNYPYSFIGRELELSPNTVKSVCRRKGLEAAGPRKTKAEKETAILCKNCRKPLPYGARNDAVFCSDRCRTEWRRKNRKVIEKKT